MIRTIAGRNNDSVKLAQKLQKKKYRRERGLFVTEGMDLLVAGVEAGVLPVEVLVRDDLVRRLPQPVWDAAQRDEIHVGVCSAELLQQAASLAGAVDVVALFPAPSWSLGHLALAEGVSVYLYGVGDPGNMGTIVRSAVAFGAGGVMTSPGSADAFGPKALRAGMGAHFCLPVVEEVAPADLLAKLDALARGGAAVPRLVVADPRGDLEVSTVAAIGNLPTVVRARRRAWGATRLRTAGRTGDYPPEAVRLIERGHGGHHPAVRVERCGEGACVTLERSALLEKVGLLP